MERNHILIGEGNSISRLDVNIWKKNLDSVSEICTKRRAFMTDLHKEIRYFAVRTIAATGSPITIGQISSEFKIPESEVESLLSDLEKNLFFVTRDGGKEITWAYPVTADKTKHRIKFSTGEETYAA